MNTRALLRSWSTVLPVASALLLALTWTAKPQGALALLVGLVLAGTVLAAVQHAEVIAHKVGEPLGSIILAVSVTVLEVGMIAMSMSGAQPKPTLARDTVFAAVMISLNGVVGAALFVNAGRRGHARFRPRSTGEMLATVTALATLTMVLPNFTSNAGPTFRPAQLAFAGLMSVALYVLFIATQSTTHRDYFLPVDADGNLMPDTEHAAPPSARKTATSGVLLAISLIAVVGLAKVVTPALSSLIEGVGLPGSVVGVVIAALVLGPETMAAVRAASRDRVQTSMNLAYGSSVASIGLTIPALALMSPLLPSPLVLGLEPLHMVLLALTVVVGVLTVVSGRATRLQAGVHLTVLAAYVYLVAVP